MKNEPRSVAVTCRLCDAPVAHETDVCPSCGVKAPWVPDEPSVNPRVIRFAMWGAGIVVGLLLLFVAGMLVFGRSPRTRSAINGLRVFGLASGAEIDAGVDSEDVGRG
jgi:hypothetical protein